MSDIDVVTVGDWALALFAHESERRVRDVELAQRLEFAQPRMFRKLIKRHRADLAKLGELTTVSTVERQEIGPKNARTGTREFSVDEFWLNRDQAMYLVAKSETAKANEITVALVLAFRELERRLKAEQQPKLTRQEIIFNRMLLEAKRDWKLLWTEDVPRELSRVYNWDLSRHKGFPVWMGNIVARIYDTVVGKDVMDEARTRRDKARKRGETVIPEGEGIAGRTTLHQWFTDETRALFEKKLDIVLALIRTSSSVADFWDRMSLEFGQSMFQLQLAFAADGCCMRCGVPVDPNSRFCSQCGTRVANKLSA